MIIAIIAIGVVVISQLLCVLYYMREIHGELLRFRKEFNIHFNDGLVEKLKMVMEVARAQGAGADIRKVASGKARYHKAF